VSYSLYLSHMLLLVVMQYALLRWLPGLTRTTHLWTLLAMTTVTTIGASLFLYRYLEAPGIWAGRALADRFGRAAAPARVRQDVPGSALHG
jgi:peptidoglycan/LPS O-acetylase OafA/YrhL